MLNSNITSSFRLINTDQFVLPRTHDRFVHLATISYGFREFMYFLDKNQGTTYVEEITGGSLNKIEDDSLWYALYKFLEEKHITSFVHKEF